MCGGYPTPAEYSGIDEEQPDGMPPSAAGQNRS
jgi:hypothetical protein